MSGWLPEGARRALREWPETAAEARALQLELAGQVSLEGAEASPRTVAGVDAHFSPDGRVSYAAVAVLDLGTLELRASAMAALPTPFPYVSGLLSFRETPVALKALDLLDEPPDLVMVDGQGLAHPRRFGFACHLGLLASLPTIGVAKSRLCGRHADLEPERGDAAPLEDRGEVVGVALRSKLRCNPLFVSPGHKIGIGAALKLTLACLAGYRMPEPTRQADLLSRAHG